MFVMNKSAKLMFVLATGLSFAACGIEQESATEEEDDGSTPGGISSGGVAAGNSDAFSALGTWLRNTCEPAAALGLQDDGGAEGSSGDGGDGDDKGGNPEHQTLTFKDDGTMAVKMEIFMDAECANKMAEINAAATYRIGTEISSDPAVRELDFKFTSSSLTLLTQEVVDMFNGVEMELQGEEGGEGGEGEEGDGAPCTRTEPWVLNEVVDLATVECEDDLPAAGQARYEAISVAGDVMKMATMDGGGTADRPDGKTAETRMVVLTTEAKDDFLKQAAAK